MTADEPRQTADVISQDEVDALLDGVESGAVPTDAGYAADGQVRPYDFSAGEHIVRGRLAALDLINERFTRGLRAGLERLVHRPIEVSCQQAQSQRFSEALAHASTPCASFVISLKPLGCQGLVILDVALVGALTDAFFGGTGRDARHETGAELTPAEWRLARKCYDLCIAELRAAWSSVVPLDVELVRVESNTQFAAIVPASEAMLVRRYKVSMDAVGEIALLLPLAGIDTVREQLKSVTPGKAGKHYRREIATTLSDTELNLQTVFSRIELTLGALVSLKAGDVIDIERPDTVVVLAEGQPVFQARYGTSSGRGTVQIVGPAARTADKRSSSDRRTA